MYYDTTIDIWEFGTNVMTCCIVVMLTHVAIEIRSWVRSHDEELYLGTEIFNIHHVIF